MKTVNFQMSEELHKEMRMEAFRQDKSVKKYITDLVEKDLQKVKEQTR